MAITINTTDTHITATAASTTPLTAAHTVLASGANRVGIFLCGWNNHATLGPLSISSATWDGNAMTKLGHSLNVDDGRVEIWYITGDANVTTGNVIPTFDRAGSAGVAKIMTVTDFTDAGTPTSFIDTNSVTPEWEPATNGTNTTSGSVTSTSGDIIIGCGGLEGAGTNSASVASGWTSLGNTSPEIGTTGTYTMETSYKTSTGNSTFSVVFDAIDHGVGCACNVPENIAAGGMSHPHPARRRSWSYR